jgi:hypothetical protein
VAELAFFGTKFHPEQYLLIVGDPEHYYVIAPRRAQGPDTLEFYEYVHCPTLYQTCDELDSDDVPWEWLSELLKMWDEEEGHDLDPG